MPDAWRKPSLHGIALACAALVAGTGAVEAGTCPTSASHFNAIKDPQIRAAVIQEARSIDSRVSPAMAQQGLAGLQQSIEQTRRDIADLQSRIAHGNVLGEPERDQLDLLRDTLEMQLGLLELTQCRARAGPGASGVTGETAGLGTTDARSTSLSSGMEQGMARAQGDAQVRAQVDAAGALAEWRPPKGYAPGAGGDPASKIELADVSFGEPGPDEKDQPGSEHQQGEKREEDPLEARWRRLPECGGKLSTCNNVDCQGGALLPMSQVTTQTCLDECGRRYEACLRGEVAPWDKNAAEKGIAQQCAEWDVKLNGLGTESARNLGYLAAALKVRDQVAGILAEVRADRSEFEWTAGAARWVIAIEAGVKVWATAVAAVAPLTTVDDLLVKGLQVATKRLVAPQEVAAEVGRVSSDLAVKPLITELEKGETQLAGLKDTVNVLKLALSLAESVDKNERVRAAQAEFGDRLERFESSSRRLDGEVERLARRAQMLEEWRASLEKQAAAACRK